MVLQSTEMLQLVEERKPPQIGGALSLRIGDLANCVTTANTMSDNYPVLHSVIYTKRGRVFGRHRSGPVALSAGVQFVPRSSDDNLVLVEYTIGDKMASLAAQKEPNAIVAKDPWGEYAGVFENDQIFEEVMDLVEQERVNQRMQQ